MEISDLSAAERDELANWEFKFHTKGYPIVGKLVVPPPPPAGGAAPMSLAELKKHDGSAAVEGTGRVDPPLYVGCRGKVFDVSFGGNEMYKKGATYHLFVGIDASDARQDEVRRGVPEESRPSDLSADELAVLDDWAGRFENKLYPVVGLLPTFPAES